MIGSNQDHPQGGTFSSDNRSVPEPVAGSQVPPPLPPDAQSPATGRSSSSAGSTRTGSASTFFAGLSGQSAAASFDGATQSAATASPQATTSPVGTTPAQPGTVPPGGRPASGSGNGRGTGVGVGLGASGSDSNGGTATGQARGFSQQAELYAELFGVAPAPRQSRAAEHRQRMLQQVQAPPPPSPRTLRESGLSANQVCDLILKQLYLQGTLLGVELARNARLPFNVIDECLRFLKDDRCIEVSSGDVIGRVSYRFVLTEIGRTRAKEAFDYCRYVGPAPVPLEKYVEQCRRQAVSGINCTAESLQEAFEALIIEPHLLAELGPAVCSGRSIFLYGPPGNGKSQIAKGLGKFLNLHGGEIYVPYAIQSENSIVTIFDPSLHHTTDDAEVSALLGDTRNPQTQQDINHLLHENHPDMRWRRVRRPVVVTGGELTLDMLDLRFNQASNFYVAPLQVKANGGVFMIDDFGRQIAKPRDLLNRWILPLEERIDYVTLATGKKFPVPFEQLIIFSTNLDPADLVDDAFLRRIRHKIKIGTPVRELYTEIFSLCCTQRQIAYEPRAVEYLYQKYYDHGQLPRSSDPRDLLEIIQSICRFRNQRLVLTQELVDEAAQRFFAKV